LEEEVYSEKSGYQGNKARNLSTVAPTPKQKRLLSYLNKQPRGSFLDVGCSSGELMFLLKKISFEVKGVELNRRTADIARANNLNVTLGTLEDASYPDNSFAYVHMGDFIEHVPDPRSLIVQARRILKPHGQLIIVTPNMDCFWARASFALYRLFKIPPAVITPPHHLFQFSYANLTRLLQENGFEFKQAWYGSVPSLKYELGSMHLLKRWKNKRTLGNLCFMLFSFGLYTIVYGLNKVVELFPVRRFSMALVAQKT
jgi:SAM-dependent methyltransferase